MKNFAILVLILFSAKAIAVSVTDFQGNTVELETPAKRIIALAPHIVENLFSAGAGDSIIGVVEHCDFPEQAKSIPRLGSMGNFGLETIVGLKPDLVVVWTSGKGGQIYSQLRELGIPTYASTPKTLSDIAKSIRDLGELTGNFEHANSVANTFEHRLKELRTRYAHKRLIGTFYQVWNEPILTINKQSTISDVIALCGGVNVFSQEPAIVPKLSIESVIAKNPEVILASGMAKQRPAWLDSWKDWPSINAVVNNNLFFVDPDIIQRHSVRVLDGADIVCQQLESARSKSEKSPE